MAFARERRCVQPDGVCAGLEQSLKGPPTQNAKTIVTQNCPVLYRKGWVSDYRIPGCGKAWSAITQAKQIGALDTLVKTDCAVMHRNKWRLPVDGGVSNPSVCAPAWNNLKKANQLGNVEVIVSHNCPVLYKKGWVK